MEKIFYVEKSAYPSSQMAIQKILTQHFQLPNADIERNKNGKPYLHEQEKYGFYFSVTHTKSLLFIAVSNKNVGIDAERLDREFDYYPILKKFNETERNGIQTTADFLRLWTIKESAVKYIGGTLARDLKKISYINGRIYYENIILPVTLSTKEFDGHVISVVGERDFSNIEFIPLD